MADTTDLLIIGGGCAGLTAAIYAIRAGLSATVLEGGFAGGQIAVTNEIENYPGYVKISGPDLAMKIYEQAQRLGADIQMEQVLKASLASPVKTLQTNGGEYKGKSVIIANGVKRRTLDCPGEKELTGKGVSYCATCDGAFFRGQSRGGHRRGKYRPGRRSLSVQSLRKRLSDSPPQCFSRGKASCGCGKKAKKHHFSRRNRRKRNLGRKSCHRRRNPKHKFRTRRASPSFRCFYSHRSGAG